MKFNGLIFPEAGHQLEEMIEASRKQFEEKGMTAEQWSKVDTEDLRLTMMDQYYQQVFCQVSKLAHKTFAENLKNARHNERVIIKKYRSVFKLYSVYIHAGYAVYAHIGQQTLGSNFEGQDRVIMPMYGMLFRMADQIGMLLFNGYTDGALRLWRSLYEHMVVLLLFLKNYDMVELSERFIDHQIHGQRKRAHSFEEHGPAMMKKELEPELKEQIEKRAKELEVEYGKEFLKSEFAWAAPALPDKSRITFREIEKAVDVSRLRPAYIWASEYNHPRFTSLMHFMEENSMSIGTVIQQETDFQKFMDPLQFTIGVLDEANIFFLERYSTESEYEANRYFFKNIFQKMLTATDKFTRKTVAK